MHIELIGCTSAGKTTLTRKIVDIAKSQDVNIILGDDFVLEKFHLDRIKSEFVRRRLLEVCAIYVCLRHWKRYRQFCRYVWMVVSQVPGSRFYRFNLVRIVLRKIGIYHLINGYGSENQLVLVDNEGIIQAAHNLFVHTHNKLNGNISAFIEEAPLPDMVVYLWQPQSILMERTLRRGHPRIQKRSESKVRFFVEQANDTFEKLKTLPRIAERLLLIDGQKKTVTKPPSVNGTVIDQIHDLMSKGIMDNHMESTPTNESQLDSSSLTLINRLGEQLLTNGISYCHWKSNINLKDSLEGKADLDLFVGSQSVSSLLNSISDLGFKAARIRYGPETPGVTHHYGLDPVTGKLVHLHLFTELVTGESFVKSHNLPFEQMLLENCRRVGQLAVLSKPAELVLFVLRTFIKYGSPLDMIRLYGNAAELQDELQWLGGDDDIGKSLALLNEYCPAVSESCFLNCVEAINGNYSFLKRIILARRVRKSLRNYSKYNLAQRLDAYGRLLLAKFVRTLGGNRRNKTLSTGGAVIAFVGADATGKSTLVAETEHWLGKVFAVRKVHVGKPPTSMLTILFNIALPLVRRLLPQLRRSQVQVNNAESSQDEMKPISSPIYALRALSLAWDRHRLLRKVEKAKAHGEIVICDRYPSELAGAMDSPRLKERLDRSGLKITLLNWLARKERELYNRMPPPDIAIKLTVSLAVAKQRNSERTKGDKDTEEFIELRHRNAREWNKTGTRHSFEINTDKPLQETILNTKKAIWGSL